MRGPPSALVLAAIISLASADVQFTSPSAGAKLTGGSTFDVAWEDSGDAPSISDLTGYQLFVCAGSNGNQAPRCASLQDRGTFDGQNKASVEVPVGFGASTPDNAYFLKMLSTATGGGTVINFSHRFSLSGMTGTFPADLLTDLKTVQGTAGPASVAHVAGAKRQAVAPAPAAAEPFSIPYTLQTGLTRYAPMQPQPPTKITKQNATPLWPTSGTTVATTWLPVPSIVTTLTQTGGGATTTHVNTVAAAPQPSDDMAKFLARWKD